MPISPDFNLTEHDQFLISGIDISISATDRGEPVAGFPGGSSQVVLQFPARLKSDQKDARWDTVYDTIMYEPGYKYKGGGPRRAQLEFVYVVGGPGGDWNVSDVAREVRKLKSYFYIGGQGFDFLPVYNITLYEHCPIGANSRDGNANGLTSSWRGKSITVNHSPELITTTDVNGNSQTYPIKTEVVLALELTTKIANNQGERQVIFSNIADSPAQEWY